jgi:hypothetical protein
VFEFVVVVDRGVLCSPRFHGVVTLVSDCQVVLLCSFLRILSVKSLGCCGRLGCNRISLPRLDRSRGVDNTTSSYKPSPQARYLVEKMSKSEKNLVEAVNRLAAKMDSYDQRFTSLGSDISKIQSQVDLLMHSIQVLQEE